MLETPPIPESPQTPASQVSALPSQSTKSMDMIVGAVFLLLIGLVSYSLFFVTSGTPLFGNVQEAEELAKNYGTLRVAYDQPLLTYEPTVSDLVTRGYLANTYEGLVRFDVNLNLEPALALSWGILDDTTWQFKLRPDVMFHDGSLFDANDVVESVDRARMHPDSQVQDLVSSVDEVLVNDDLLIQIVTSNPDPLLLNKLTALPIVPSESRTRISTPIGTGPYVFNRTGGDVWKFTRNNSYWGELPAYPELALMFVPDKFERYESFTSGDIDVMAQVPPVFVDPLLDQESKIASQPSLDVSFFLFNWKGLDSPFRHRELRDALRYVFDPDQMSKLTGGFSRPIGQFVSRGVFGYNPDLDVFPYDLSKARSILEPLGKNILVQLDLPKGLEALGDYADQQMTAIGLSSTVVYWEPEVYSERVLSGESDFFFFGWRSDLGDAGDFFTKLIHSKTSDGRYGSLNGGRYEESVVDDLIEKMERNLLESQRQEALQELMDLVVNDDIIGVPLFETDVLVGIQKDLKWDPRVDNFILATDFK